MSGVLVMESGPFGDAVSPSVSALVSALVGASATGRIPAADVHLDLDDQTIDLAVAEGLGPVLGARVADDVVSVPGHRRDALLWENKMCAASNLMRARALAEVAVLYQRSSIPIMLLKGMAIIQSAWRPDERSMGDVDVIVPPSRWDEACAILVERGFSELRIQRRHYTAEHDYVRSFTSGVGVPIEIHRFVCERTFVSLDYEGADGLFARARPLPSGLLIPEDGDLFLTLAVHAAKHTFDLPLRSFLDGLVLQRRRPLDSSQLSSRAAAWGMRAALRAWLLSLRRLESGAPHLPIGRASIGDRCAALVWSRTSHAPAWQRFIRLAWLSDSAVGWTRHVITRGFLRAMDFAVSVDQATSEDISDRTPDEKGRFL